MIVIKVLRRLLGGVKRLIRERTISSEEFVDHLRSCGCEIGKVCLFQSPQTACVDITRPVLVTIGDKCVFLEKFTLLTHDNITKVFGNVYHEFLPS